MSQAKIAYAIWPWGCERKEQVYQAVKEIKEVGYNAYESISTAADIFKDSREEFKEFVKKSGVRPVSFYYHLSGDYPSDLDRIEKGMPFLEENDIHRISLQAMGSGGVRATDEELAVQAEIINKIGLISSKYGVVPCVHTHHNTKVMYENDIDYIMNNTDPKYVSFGPDTAHLVAAGCDPYTIFARYIDRIQFMHLKDFRMGRDVGSQGYNDSGVEVYTNFMELGRGDIDFPAIFKLLKDNNYSGYMTIELDNPHFTKQESAKISFDYMQKNFYNK